MGRADARRAQQRGARRAAKSGGIRRLFTWRKMLGTFFGFCLLIMGAFVALYLYVDIPKANALAERQSNVYQYSDGTVLTHAWMIAARGDLAVAVFVDTGESGSGTAGPLLEAFLRRAPAR